MKVVITEDQFNRVILKEQSGRCDQWKNGTFQNGDGITTPKITITKSPIEIIGIYEGPDNGGCIQRAEYLSTDTPHQLAGITVFYEAAPYLKELYTNGDYVTIGKITMERDRDKMFKITIPLVSTTEDKAITNMNERGGMGHSGSGPYNSLMSAVKNDSDNKLIGKQTVSAGDITENFIYWRNISQYPIRTTSSSPTKPITITFKGYADFRQQLRDLPKDAYGDATIKDNIITLTKDENTRISKLSGIRDNISEDTFSQRLKEIKNDYGYEAISDIVKVGSEWFVVLKTE
jgi:hypothetical protein